MLYYASFYSGSSSGITGPIERDSFLKICKVGIALRNEGRPLRKKIHMN